MLQPSLHSSEDFRCDQCRQKFPDGHEVFHIMLEFYESGEPLFAQCCSRKCVDHAIEDHGNELELYSRHAGR